MLNLPVPFPLAALTAALQARAACVQQSVLGYYRIPASADQPLDVVVNPQGLQARSEVRPSFRCQCCVLLCGLCLGGRRWT